MQSLADIAREEADRRKRLDVQGVEAKVIDRIPDTSAPDSDLALSTPDSRDAEKSKAPSRTGRDPASPQGYRTALRKLDRAIRKDQERLESLKSRLQSEKWAIAPAGRSSKGVAAEESRNRLRADIEELELKLKELRRERSEVYEEGRKAGFLPGELDGRGVVP
jgi:hypothetical protein